MISVSGKLLEGDFFLIHEKVYRDGAYYEGVRIDGLFKKDKFRDVSISGALCSMREFTKRLTFAMVVEIENEVLTDGQKKLIKKMEDEYNIRTTEHTGRYGEGI